MKDYSQLDAAILSVIKTNSKKTMFNDIAADQAVNNHVKIVKMNTGRDPERIVDARLKAMAKAKKIVYSARDGWSERYQ